MILKELAWLFQDMETLCCRWLCTDMAQPLSQWLGTLRLQAVAEDGYALFCAEEPLPLKTQSPVHLNLLRTFRWGQKTATMRENKALRLPLYTLAEEYLLQGRPEEEIRHRLRHWHIAVGYSLAAEYILTKTAEDGMLPTPVPPLAMPQLELLLAPQEGKLQLLEKRLLGCLFANRSLSGKQKKTLLAPLKAVEKKVADYSSEEIAFIGNQYTYRSLILDVKYGRNYSTRPGYGVSAPVWESITKSDGDAEIPLAIDTLTPAPAAEEGKPAADCWAELSAADISWRATSRSSMLESADILKPGFGLNVYALEKDLPRPAWAAVSGEDASKNEDFFYHFRTFRPEHDYRSTVTLFHWADPCHADTGMGLPSAEVQSLYAHLVSHGPRKYDSYSLAEQVEKLRLAESCIAAAPSLPAPVPAEWLIRNDLRDTLWVWRNKRMDVSSKSMFNIPYKADGGKIAMRYTLCDPVSSKLLSLPDKVFHKQLVVYLLWLAMDAHPAFYSCYNALKADESLSPAQRLTDLLGHLCEAGLRLPLPEPDAVLPTQDEQDRFVAFYREFSCLFSFAETKSNAPEFKFTTAGGRPVSVNRKKEKK